MTEDVFPEIQAAARSVESRIAMTEKEVADMKEAIKSKKRRVYSWRKALKEFASEPGQMAKAGRK